MADPRDVKYRVTRTEKILYSKVYTEQELIDLGVPAKEFKHDWQPDVTEVINHVDAVREALEEDIEPHADVQGSVYDIERVG